VLMNLLPGLRELRAPLAAGYLWLIALWLWLGRMGWVPAKRPPGSGEVARLWDLGGTLGRTVVLAAVTFVAYLVGSFLEMDPVGRLAQLLAPVVLFDRVPSYPLEILDRSSDSSLDWETIEVSFPELGHTGKPPPTESAAEEVARALSPEARMGLVDLLDQGNRLPDIDSGLRLPEGWSRRARGRRYDLRTDLLADQVIYRIIIEMPQLASRLLVKNKDLYGQYDRQMAEASLRMNVSIPLTLLLVSATWLSSLSIWLRAVLTIAAAGFGYMLLRQGFLRAVSGRDVIAQALAIDEVQSRYIAAEEKAVGSTEKPTEGKEAARTD
jgi:hypothetical protein